MSSDFDRKKETSSGILRPVCLMGPSSALKATVAARSGGIGAKSDGRAPTASELRQLQDNAQNGDQIARDSLIVAAIKFCRDYAVSSHDLFPQDAEPIAHEVVCKYSVVFSKVDHPGAYLRQGVRRKVIDYLRKKNGRETHRNGEKSARQFRTRPVQEPVDIETLPDQSGRHVAESVTNRLVINEALAALPHEEQLVVYYRIKLEMTERETVHELATKHNISLSIDSVGRRYTNALKSLRTRLSKEWNDERNGGTRSDKPRPR
jgi:RNA polymerase sigma factor (sigma-70 family)